MPTAVVSAKHTKLRQCTLGDYLPPAMSAPSGSAISSDSATVAEGQRMDAAADAGTIVNAPTTSTTSGQQAPSSESVADPYNSSFMNNYLTT